MTGEDSDNVHACFRQTTNQQQRTQPSPLKDMNVDKKFTL